MVPRDSLAANGLFDEGEGAPPKRPPPACGEGCAPGLRADNGPQKFAARAYGRKRRRRFALPAQSMTRSDLPGASELRGASWIAAGSATLLSLGRRTSKTRDSPRVFESAVEARACVLGQTCGFCGASGGGRFGARATRPSKKPRRRCGGTVWRCLPRGRQR